MVQKGHSLYGLCPFLFTREGLTNILYASMPNDTNQEPLTYRSFGPKNPQTEYYKQLGREQSQTRWQEGRQARAQEAQQTPLSEEAKFLDTLNKTFKQEEEAHYTQEQRAYTQEQRAISAEDRGIRKEEKEESKKEKQASKRDKQIGDWLSGINTRTPGKSLGFSTEAEYEDYLTKTKPETLVDITKFKANDPEEIGRARSAVEEMGASLVLSGERPQVAEGSFRSLEPQDKANRLLSKSKYGLTKTEDGSYVVDERFLARVNDPSTAGMRNENIARAIVNNLKSIISKEDERGRSDYLIPDVEEVTNLVRNARAKNRETYQEYEKIRERFAVPKGEEEQKAVAPEKVGEQNGGDSSRTQPTLVQHVLSEVDRFFTVNPEAMEYLNTLGAKTGEEIPGAIEDQKFREQARRGIELKDQLARAISEANPAIDLRTVRNELDDDALLYREAVSQFYGGEIPEEVSSAILNRTTQLAQQRQALVASDYAKAEKDAIAEHLKSLGLDEGVALSMGISGLTNRHIAESDTGMGTMRSAVNEALQQYQSGAGQLAASMSFGEQKGYRDPLSHMQWVNIGDGKMAYAFVDPGTNERVGNGFIVDFGNVDQQAKALGVSREAYLDNLALPFKMGNLNATDEANSLFAWDKLNGKLVENATAESTGGLAYYDNDLIERSVLRAVEAGAPAEVVDKYRENLLQLQKQNAKDMIDQMLGQYEAVANLVASDSKTLDILFPGIRLAMNAMHNDFRDYYAENKGKMTNEEIISSFLADEQNRQGFLAITMAGAKTVARYKAAAIGASQFVSEGSRIIGLGTGDPAKYNNMWENLHKEEQAINTITTRAGGVAEWGAEIGNVLLQIAETTTTGGIGGVSGRVGTMTGRLAKLFGEAVAFKAATPGTMRLGQVITKLGGGVERLVAGPGRAALTQASSRGSSLAISAKLFTDAAAPTFGEVSNATYNEEMARLAKDPETSGLSEAIRMEMAQNVATTKGSIAGIGYGIFSTILNNRAGFNRMIRKATGATTKAPGIFGKLESSLEGPGIFNLKGLPGKEKAISIAKQVGRLSASAVEGGTEELADEALQWAWQTLTQHGEIREEDIASERDVWDAASKIFILGAIGGEVGHGIQAMTALPAEVSNRRDQAIQAQQLYGEAMRDALDSDVEGANTALIEALKEGLEKSSAIADAAITSKEAAMSVARNGHIQADENVINEWSSMISQLPDGASVQLNNFSAEYSRLKRIGDEMGAASLHQAFVEDIAASDNLSDTQRQIAGELILQLTQGTPTAEFVEETSTQVVLPEGLEELAAVEVEEAPAPVTEEPRPEGDLVEQEVEEEVVQIGERDYGYNAPNPVPFVQMLSDWYTSETPITPEIRGEMNSVLTDLELEDPDIYDFITDGKEEVDRATVRRLLTVANLTGPDGPLAVDMKGNTEIQKGNALLTDKTVWSKYDKNVEIQDSNWAADVFNMVGEGMQPIQNVLDDVLNTVQDERTRNNITDIVRFLEGRGVPISVATIQGDSNIAGLTMMDPSSPEQHIALNFSAKNVKSSPADVLLHELTHVLDNHLRETDPLYAERVASIEEIVRSNWANIQKEAERVARTAVTEEEQAEIDQFIAEMEQALFNKQTEFEGGREFLPNVITNPIMGEVIAQGNLPFDQALDQWASPNNLARISQIGRGKVSRIVHNLINAVSSILKGAKVVEGKVNPNTAVIRVEEGTLADPTRMKIVSPKLAEYKPGVEDENVFITDRGVDAALFSSSENFVGAGKRLFRTANVKGGFTADKRTGKKVKEFAGNFQTYVNELVARNERTKRYVTQQTKGMEDSERATIINSIVNYTGDLGNTLDPKVTRRIFAETNNKVEQARVAREAEVDAANNEYAKFIADRRKAIIQAEARVNALAGTQALQNVGVAITQAVQVAKEVPQVDEKNPMAVAAARFRKAQEELNPVMKEIYSTLDEDAKAEMNEAYDKTMKAIAEDLAQDFDNPAEIVPGLLSIGGLQNVPSVDDLSAMFTSVIKANRLGWLKKDADAVRAAKDITVAQQARRERIAQAEKNYQTKVGRGGMKNGVWTSPGTVWLERDAAMRAEKNRMETVYAMKRNEARKELLKYPFGARLLNVLDDNRRAIATMEANLMHRRGAIGLGTKVRDFTYLSRTFAAVGKESINFRKAMKELLDSNGEVKPEFTHLVGILNNAIQSYMRENISRYNQGISETLDNMLAMSKVADELGLDGSEYLGFKGKDVWKNVSEYLTKDPALAESALNTINNGHWNEIAKMKDGSVELRLIINKASQLDNLLSSADVGEKSRLRSKMRKAKADLMNKAAEDYVLSSMGVTDTDLRSFLLGLNSPEQITEAFKSTPYLDSSVISNLMGTDENLRTRISNTLDYVRKSTAIEMQKQGVNLTANQRDMSLLADGEVADALIATARNVFKETLSKERNEENIFANRKNLMDSELQILGVRGFSNLTDAFGVIQNTLSSQGRAYVNQVITHDVARSLERHGVVTGERTKENTHLLEFQNKANPLNGMYAERDIALVLYQAMRPDEAIMRGKEFGKKLQSHWGNNWGMLRSIGGFVSMLTLVRTPSATLRNMAGTMGQSLNAGALPFDKGVIKGYGEVYQLAQDFVVANILSAAGSVGVRGAVNSEIMANAEKRFNQSMQRYRDLGLLDAGAANFMKEQWKQGLNEMSQKEGSEISLPDEDAMFSSLVSELGDRSTAKKAMDLAKRIAYGTFVSPMSLAASAYSVPDVIAKIILFNGESHKVSKVVKAELAQAEKLSRAGKEDKLTSYMKDALAAKKEGTLTSYIERRAADRTKNLLPTGARTPDWVNKVSIFGMPFFSFMYHTWQSVPYSIGYGMEELRAARFATNTADKVSLYMDATQKFGGAILGQYAMMELMRFALPIVTQAIMGMVTGDDEEDKMQMLEASSFTRWLARNAGLSADYDQNGELFFWFDKDNETFIVQDGQYLLPYKSLGETLGAIINLAGLNPFSDKSEANQFEDDYTAQLLDYVQSTAGSPSMWIQMLIDMGSKEPRQSADLKQLGGVSAIPEAFGNALLMSLGLRPSAELAGGRTLDWMERIATTVKDNLPLWPTLVQGVQTWTGMNPDSEKAGWLLKNLGFGVRRPKNINDVLRDSLAKGNKDLSNSLKNQRIMDTNLYTADLSDAEYDKIIEADKAMVIEQSISLANRFLALKGFLKGMGVKDVDTVLEASAQEVGISLKAMDDLISGRAKDFISNQRFDKIEETRDRLLNRPGITPEAKKAILRQFQQAEKVYDIDAVDITSSLIEPDNVEQEVKSQKR